MWYRRLFGDTSRFGIEISLHADEHPQPGTDPTLGASWGSFGLWVDGRCLTQSSQQGTVRDSIEWYLLPLLRWAAHEAVALFNEEPFPLPTRRTRLKNGFDWLLASEDPPWSQTESEESDWHITRFDWQHRHALWHAFEGAVVPSVMFRRFGDRIEVSWDNETWPPSRRDLRFTELSGSSLLAVEDVESVWLEFVAEVSGKVRERLLAHEPVDIPMHVVPPSPDDWKYLVPSNASAWLGREPQMRQLVSALRDAASTARLIIPHRIETRLLRECGEATDDDLRSILGLRASQGQMAPLLESLRMPRPAPAQQPWLDGYEAALSVRESLGWGAEPAPDDLGSWCEEHNVDLVARRGSSQYDAAVLAPSAHRPLIGINPNGRRSQRWSERFMTAASLGAILLDSVPERDFGFVFGPREHWPSAARARAFAAMLLMPVDGVRRLVEEIGRKTFQELRFATEAIMKAFGTSVRATTAHLHNLDFIDDEERLDLVSALSAV